MTTKQNLHLHERRGITFQELGALLGVRELVRRQLVTHTEEQHAIAGQHLINMGIQCDLKGCGTTGCIGGTMAFLMGKNQNDAKDYVGWQGQIGNASPAFQSLFFPPSRRNNGRWWKNIPAKAILKAIDNWLENGKPRWNVVCPPKKVIKKRK